MAVGSERQTFKIVEHAEGIVRFPCDRLDDDLPFGCNAEQAERLLLLVLDGKKTAIRRLLDGRRFVDARHEAEGRYAAYIVPITLTNQPRLR